MNALSPLHSASFVAAQAVAAVAAVQRPHFAVARRLLPPAGVERIIAARVGSLASFAEARNWGCRSLSVLPAWNATGVIS